MSDGREPALYRMLSLELDSVTTGDELSRFAQNVSDWFDNGVPIHVYVDSETNLLMIEQKYV